MSKIYVQAFPELLKFSGSLAAGASISGSLPCAGYSQLVGYITSSGSPETGSGLCVQQSVNGGSTWDINSGSYAGAAAFTSSCMLDIIGNAVNVRFAAGAASLAAVRMLFQLKPVAGTARMPDIDVDVISSGSVTVTAGSLVVTAGSIDTVKGGSIIVTSGCLDAVKTGSFVMTAGSITSISGGSTIVTSGCLDEIKTGSFTMTSGSLDTVKGGSIIVTSGCLDAIKSGSFAMTSGSLDTVKGGSIIVTSGCLDEVKTGSFVMTAGSITSLTGGSICVSSGSGVITSGSIDIVKSGSFVMTAGSISTACIQPFAPIGVTAAIPLVKSTDTITACQFGNAASCLFGVGQTGELLAHMLLYSACGASADAKTPGGYVYCFSGCPAIVAGCTSVAASDYAHMFGRVKVTSTDWDLGSACYGANYIYDQPVPFPAASKLWFAFKLTTAACFNDSTDSERLHMISTYRRDS